MPRKLRIQYPGAIYHLLNRGDQREFILRDNEKRQMFLGKVQTITVRHARKPTRKRPSASWDPDWSRVRGGPITGPAQRSALKVQLARLLRQERPWV